MEFYCEPCETAMCRECTEGERREHRDHRTVPLRDVLEQHKAALQHQLDAVRARYGAWGAPWGSPWPTPTGCRASLVPSTRGTGGGVAEGIVGIVGFESSGSPHVFLLQDTTGVGYFRVRVGLVGIWEFRGSPCLLRLPQLAAAVGLVAEISRQLGQCRAEAEAEIGSSFEELEAALRQRREVLLRDLEATCAAKQQVTNVARCPSPTLPGRVCGCPSHTPVPVALPVQWLGS